MVDQESEVTQGLVTSKLHLTKQAVNVRDILQPDCDPLIHCRLYSTVAHYWIHGSGEYHQFVANRMNKIQQHQGTVWHHIPTDQNPADLGRAEV